MTTFEERMAAAEASIKRTAERMASQRQVAANERRSERRKKKAVERQFHRAMRHAKKLHARLVS